MLERCLDAERINGVVNHPEVRPYVGAPEAGYLDLTDVVVCDEHWFLMGEHGGFALLWTAPRAYEVHTFILKNGRGKWANGARTQMINFARQHEAKVLWTKVPFGARHVERFARQGGMHPTGETVKTFGVPHQVLEMELG